MKAELRNELRETYSTLRKAQSEKMKKEFQENAQSIGVDEQEKKLAEE